MKKLHGCYDQSWNDFEMNLNIPSNIFIMFSKQLSKFQTKKKSIDNLTQICIECGNKIVLINENEFYCKNCYLQFKIKEEKNGCFM